MSHFTGTHKVNLIDSELNEVGTDENPLKCSVTGAGSGGTSSVDESIFLQSETAGTAVMGVVNPTDVGVAANKLAIAALDDNRNICVNVKAGSGSGLSVTDKAAWTASSSNFVPSGGVYKDDSTDLTAGEEGTVRLTPNRAFHSNPRKQDGTEIGTPTDPIRVDPTGSTTQPVSGTVTANAGTDLNTSLLARETGGNLASIKTNTDKIPALGQALAAGSVPVVLTAAQITTLTPPAAITNFANETGGNLATIAAATKLEDSGHSTGDRGMAVLGVRNEGHQDFSGSDLDYIPLGLDASGSLFIKFDGTQTVQANAGTNLNTSALALETGGNLAEIKTNTDNIPALGQTTKSGSVPVTLASDQGALPVSFTGSGDVATQTTLAAINTKLVSGTDIGDVTINNGSGVNAVNIQDGGNTITVDGTVNTNTTLAAETTKVIGTVISRKPAVSRASSAGTAITTNTNTQIVAAPSAGYHLKIHRLWAQNSGATGTWCYWGNGSGVLSLPFYLAQYQPFSMAMEGRWNLSSATGLFLNTATTGANIQWYVEYETEAD